MKPSQRNFLIAAALFIVVVGITIIAARDYFGDSQPTESITTSQPVTIKPQQEVVLYYGASDGTYLLPEIRTIDECFEDTKCIKEIVQALIGKPGPGMVMTIPSSAKLLGVSINDDLAILNFSNELITGHTGGSAGELLTVYSLANTIAANLPNITSIKIMVAGQKVDTIRGHIDLRGSIRADLRYNQPPEPIKVERSKEK